MPWLLPPTLGSPAVPCWVVPHTFPTPPWLLPHCPCRTLTPFLTPPSAPALHARTTFMQFHTPYTTPAPALRWFVTFSLQFDCLPGCSYWVVPVRVLHCYLHVTGLPELDYGYLPVATRISRLRFVWLPVASVTFGFATGSFAPGYIWIGSACTDTLRFLFSHTGSCGYLGSFLGWFTLHAPVTGYVTITRWFTSFDSGWSGYSFTHTTLRYTLPRLHTDFTVPCVHCTLTVRWLHLPHLGPRLVLGFISRSAFACVLLRSVAVYRPRYTIRCVPHYGCVTGLIHFGSLDSGSGLRLVITQFTMGSSRVPSFGLRFSLRCSHGLLRLFAFSAFTAAPRSGSDFRLLPATRTTVYYATHVLPFVTISFTAAFRSTVSRSLIQLILLVRFPGCLDSGFWLVLPFTHISGYTVCSFTRLVVGYVHVRTFRTVGYVRSPAAGSGITLRLPPALFVAVTYLPPHHVPAALAGGFWLHHYTDSVHLRFDFVTDTTLHHVYVHVYTTFHGC